MNNDFKTNQTVEGPIKNIGDSQPPRKQILIIIDNHSMLLYSARKNSAKVIEAYSTL